jgi:hypothetical protein
MVVPKLGAVKNELGLAHNFMLFELYGNGGSAMLREIGPSRFKHGQRIVLDFDANPNELDFKNNSSESTISYTTYTCTGVLPLVELHTCTGSYNVQSTAVRFAAGRYWMSSNVTVVQQESGRTRISHIKLKDSGYPFE